MSDEFQGTNKPEWFLARVRKAKLLEKLYANEGYRMNAWEQGFCEGIQERFWTTDEPHFSDAQELKMDELLQKY